MQTRVARTAEALGNPCRFVFTAASFEASGVVRGAGLEPAQYCYRQDLNLVRLPISPPARLKQQATGPEEPNAKKSINPAF
jgi:hypothetical protein